MHLAPVDISELVGTIVVGLEKAHPGRNVQCKIEDGLTAKVDQGLLRVALENLLSNAWKFTSKIPEAHIEFGQAQSNGISAYYVRDDGAGFDPRYAGRLFGAFQRLHTASEFPGTGIGLATVMRIVRRHGGHLWAESQIGQGATFYFTLVSEPEEGK
jgi:light-regulated signal transduction histidine kinase (bacteriophytochrome)